MSREELLKARPILFNTEMVKAILDGRKTETRRTVKLRYKDDEYGFEVITNRGTGESWMEKIDEEEMTFDPPRYINPPYQPGDILYVRETWQYLYELDGNEQIIEGTGRYYYAATDQIPFNTYVDSSGISHEKTPWKPSIHMPKEAARIFLKVTDIRPERLQDIDDNGVVAEGLQIGDPFDDLWNSTIKKADRDRYGWEANPWVWVIKFKKLGGGIDNE